MTVAYLDPGSGGFPVGGGILIIVFGWIAPSVLVGMLAGRKGYSSIGFFIMSLLVSWVIALIVVLVLRDRTQPQAVVLAGADSPPPASDRLDQLQKLTELRNAGTLSEEEFEAEKARIMSASS